MSKTVEEIARETGFSITTVRFVINGQSERYRISTATRKQIEDYIAIHGYSINHAARSLKLNRSDTVGLVVPDLANAFFARFMAELEALCRQRDLLLLTVASHEDPRLEDRALINLLARGVDGLVVAPCQNTVLPQIQRSKARTSIVMFDRDYHSSLCPAVVSDNFQGGLEMAQRMLTHAGGACYFLCGDAELPSIQDRVRGFLAAAEALAIGNGQRLIKFEADNSIVA
ncbi:MAG: substrate-binding domain-containing protein, partial [Propionivibrio sp.]